MRAVPNFRGNREASSAASSSSSAAAVGDGDFSRLKVSPGFFPQSPDWLHLISLTNYYGDTDDQSGGEGSSSGARAAPSASSNPTSTPTRRLLSFGVTPCGRSARARACSDLALCAKSFARAVFDGGASCVVTQDGNMNFFSAFGLVRFFVPFFPFFFFCPREKKKKKKLTFSSSSLSFSKIVPFFLRGSSPTSSFSSWDRPRARSRCSH